MKTNVSKKSLREFGLLIGLGFPVLIGWILPYFSGHFFRTWTLWIAIPSLIIGITKPNLLYYPYKFWMKLGFLLGWINSRIILGFVFFLVLMPISLLMKSINYDPLNTKRKDKQTYKEAIIDRETDFNRIF